MKSWANHQRLAFYLGIVVIGSGKVKRLQERKAATIKPFDNSTREKITQWMRTNFSHYFVH